MAHPRALARSHAQARRGLRVSAHEGSHRRAEALHAAAGGGSSRTLRWLWSGTRAPPCKGAPRSLDAPMWVRYSCSVPRRSRDGRRGAPMLSGSALDPECRAPVRMSVRSSLGMHTCMPLTWRVCAGSRVCERAFLLAFELACVRARPCVMSFACVRARVCACRCVGRHGVRCVQPLVPTSESWAYVREGVGRAERRSRGGAVVRATGHIEPGLAIEHRARPHRSGTCRRYRIAAQNGSDKAKDALRRLRA